MFNNSNACCAIITGMNEQMERLYLAARSLLGIDGQSAVAKVLNVSPQTVNNWEERGISNDGLLKAQEMVGCNAIWLRDGKGQMTASTNDTDIDSQIELLALFQQATPTARAMILDLARRSAKRSTVRWQRVSGD